jgi:hypothetical protein
MVVNKIGSAFATYNNGGLVGINVLDNAVWLYQQTAVWEIVSGHRRFRTVTIQPRTWFEFLVNLHRVVAGVRFTII